MARWNIADLRAVPHKAEPGKLALEIDGSWQVISPATTIWWHRAGHVDLSNLDGEEVPLVADEAFDLLVGALYAAGVRWVDDPFVVARAENRFVQLLAAQSLGVAVPATVQTNFSAGADELRHDGPVVAKAVSSGIGMAPFVAELAEGDFGLLGANPTFLQTSVPAVADLRVVTVGSQAWVWERARTAGVVDWRQADPAGAGFRLVDNQDVADSALAVGHTLRLTMSVQDWLKTDSEPVFLEVNPQGGWIGLVSAAEKVVPSLVDHLYRPAGPAAAAVGSDGRWPKALKRFGWDLTPARWAPSNDGLIAPAWTRPAWIDQVATLPDAVETASQANRAAQDAATKAEDKASRLVQVGLALLALAFAVGAYQLTFVLARSSWWWVPSLIPAGGAIVCLALAVFEAVEIDRVGLYRELAAADLAGVAPRQTARASLEIEEYGRFLARWTARHKLSDLMQARAWLARGILALIMAAGVAGGSRASSTAGQARVTPSTTTTTVPARAHGHRATTPGTRTKARP